MQESISTRSSFPKKVRPPQSKAFRHPEFSGCLSAVWYPTIPIPHLHQMSFRRYISTFLVAALLYEGTINTHADGLPQATIKSEDLDPAAFGQWLLDRPQEGELAKDGPKAAIWTRNS